MKINFGCTLGMHTTKIDCKLSVNKYPHIIVAGKIKFTVLSIVSTIFIHCKINAKIHRIMMVPIKREECTITCTIYINTIRTLFIYIIIFVTVQHIISILIRFKLYLYILIKITPIRSKRCIKWICNICIK